MSGLVTILPITPRAIGDQQTNAVSARDLHAFLGAKAQFSDWIQDQIKRARLIEHRDFEAFSPFSEKGRPRQEYALTIEAAKHIGMMAGTDKGFEVRDYFIECERRAHRVFDPTTISRTQLAQMVLESEQERLALACKVEEMSPKAAFHDQVAGTDDAVSVADFAKSINTGQQRMFRFLRDHHFLIRSSNLPYQQYLDQGLFRVVEQVFQDKHNRDRVFHKTLVTGKGQIALAKVYRAQGEALRLSGIEG